MCHLFWMFQNCTMYHDMEIFFYPELNIIHCIHFFYQHRMITFLTLHPVSRDKNTNSKVFLLLDLFKEWLYKLTLVVQALTSFQALIHI